MPPRKDQVERQAWQWAETTRPADVTYQHVLSAYILQPPHTRKTACKKNCRHQPLCIAGLGEHDWLQDSDVTRLYTGVAEEPDVRRPQVPAGLKNLGATCYVNSLLQLWFHNRKFRRAILLWEPYSDPVERANETLLTHSYTPMTAIGHLQLIFGYMHGTLLRTVDPSPFILSLRLDTMYQQDAQEFSKLFSTLLEEGLSHQSLADVSGAVQSLMRGQYEYVTKCTECLQESTCPSYFYELDLQIQGQKQLSDCLTEFLREESLTGSNQYNCQTCGGKRDASRAIRLKELPPVLNFQLMRFVFDRETGLKKKLSSHLRFPEVLDVSEFVRQPAGSVTYRLQAVLLHKGPSAYSGHYTAHICDGETGAWFRFNDEEVEKIKTLKLSAEDDLEDPVKKPKAARCPKGYHSSNQAYMLVYARVGPESPAGTPASAHVQTGELSLPDHIQLMVDAMNSSVNAQVQQNQQAKNVSVEEYRSREREIREVYPRLPCGDVRRDMLLLPASWLTSWLAGENPGPVDMAALRCQHGGLSPWHAAKTKCVDPGAGGLLVCLYGGAGLDSSALCRCCVENRCRAIRAKLELEEDARTVAALLKEELKPNEPAVWVGKTTLRIWKRLALATLPQDAPPVAPSATSDTSGPASPAGAVAGGATSAGTGRRRSTANDETCTANGPSASSAEERKGPDRDGTSAGGGEASASVTSEKGVNGEISLGQQPLVEKGKGNGVMVWSDVKCEIGSANAAEEASDTNGGVCAGKFNKHESNADMTGANGAGRDDDKVLAKTNGTCVIEKVAIPPLSPSKTKAPYRHPTRASVKRRASPHQCEIELTVSSCAEDAVRLSEPVLKAVPAATPSASLPAASVTSAASVSRVGGKANGWEEQMDTSEPVCGLIEGSGTNGVSGWKSEVPSCKDLTEQSSGDRASKVTIVASSGDELTANCTRRSPNAPSCVSPSVTTKLSSDPPAVNGSHVDAGGSTASLTSVLSSNSAVSLTTNMPEAAGSSSVSLTTDFSAGSCSRSDLTSRFDSVSTSSREDTVYDERGPVSGHMSEVSDLVKDMGAGTSAARTGPGTVRKRGDSHTDSVEVGDSSPNDDEDEEEDEEFNADVLCEHSELCVDENARRLVPEAVWFIMTKYFPEAKEYSQHRPLCEKCKDQVSEEEQMRQLYRQLATEQRAALGDLYSDRLRPQVAAPACKPGTYHAVGRHSTDLWRKFLKDPLRRDPATLETRSLICSHGGLLYSPLLTEDRNRMVFLYDWEWEVVKRSGHDGHEVVVTRTETDPNLIVTPEPCDQCIQRRQTEEHRKQLQYASTKIFIRKVENMEEELKEMASKRLRLDSGAEPVRRSSRPRRCRGEKQLTVASTDTLRDLKVQIMKTFRVAPYDQHLVFNGCPLLDGQATMGHLGIVPGSTLLLKVDEESDVVDTTVSEDLSAAANPEMGFKGTGLVSS